MSKFFENKEYFWEYEYPFGEDFLRNTFKENFKRKFSKDGNGILNMILLNDKIYLLDLKEAKSMLLNDGKKAFRDETKDIIIQDISNEFTKMGIEHTINGGKFITFKIFDYIGKIEIVKKVAMPN